MDICQQKIKEFIKYLKIRKKHLVKLGRYNLKEQAAWKSRTAFVEDTLQEILRKAANKEATVFARCYYGIELGRSEVEDRYLLSYDDAVSYWKSFDARVYQIA